MVVVQKLPYCKAGEGGSMTLGIVENSKNLRKPGPSGFRGNMPLVLSKAI